MSRFVNLVGERFGRLTVIGQAEKNKWGKSQWLCECDCGNQVIALANSLKSNHTKSCGCLQREKAAISCEKRIIHGHNRMGKVSKTYISWCSIIQRCTNPYYNEFRYYGGRGITVCKRWLKFQKFLEDMGQRPEGCSIDRKNNDQGYCRENCRWATAKQNGRNKRNNHLISHGEKTQCLSAWMEETGIQKSTIQKRLRLGWSTEKTLTTPVLKQGKGNDHSE